MAGASKAVPDALLVNDVGLCWEPSLELVQVTECTATSESLVFPSNPELTRPCDAPRGQAE